MYLPWSKAFEEFQTTKKYLQVEKELKRLVERAFITGYCTAEAEYAADVEREIKGD